MKPIYTLTLLAWMLQFLPGVPAAEAGELKRVLTLYWYGKDFPLNVTFDRGLQTVFGKSGTQYYAEYYEPNRFPGEGPELALRDYLQRKYSDRKIDVIIAMSAVSADFLIKYRSDLFPDVPIVFLTTNRTQLTRRAGGTSAGLVGDNNQARTLDLALRLHPATERVFVINGTPERDKSVEIVLKEQFKEFEGRVPITYLTDLPLSELLTQVKRLPERSLIFYSRQDYEEPRRSLSLTEVLVLVAASSKVPIYTAGAYLGFGTVGGYVLNGYESGVKAAGMALRIMNGADPRDIPVAEVTSSPMFDWRQLRRWGISVERLPPGSDVQFRERTAFERYKWQILGGLALAIVQFMLIAGLLAERRRRRLVQENLLERLEFETLLSELSAEFTRLPADELDQAIEKWLQRLVELLGAESGNLFKIPDDGELSQCPARQDFVLAVPIHVDGSTWTFTFQAPKSRRAWAKDLLPRIRLAGEILAAALARKTQAEALRQSQERYQLATSAGRVVVWDWNLDTSEIYADPLLKSLLGYEDHEVRNHYDDWLRLIHPDDVQLVMERIRCHIEGGLPRLESEHRLQQKDGSFRWFLFSGTLMRNDRGATVRMIGTGTDITQRKTAEQELQRLSTRLLDAQDQERRRIARELHDGTAQNLWALALNLESLGSQKAFPVRFRRTFQECRTLCTQSLQELRTLSYVLHPPMLDQAGLLASLRWYLSGFNKRTGIYTELIANQDIGRLPAKVEMDLFRIVQECLANIHRHSGSTTAQIYVTLQSHQVTLQVQDQGRGMPVTTIVQPSDYNASGVGLSGMAQRLRYLGGRLEIASDSQGTTITAVVPLEEEAPPLKTLQAVGS